MSLSDSIAQQLSCDESQAVYLLENWSKVYNNSVKELGYPTRALVVPHSADKSGVGVNLGEAQKAEVALLVMRQRHMQSQELLKIKYQGRFTNVGLSKRLKTSRSSIIKYLAIAHQLFFDHYQRVCHGEISYIDQLEKFKNWADELEW